MSAIIEIPRTRNPFPRTGIHAGEHGIPRYTALPGSLVAMLKASAGASPGAAAIVEIGGGRLRYEQSPRATSYSPTPASSSTSARASRCRTETCSPPTASAPRYGGRPGHHHGWLHTGDTVRVDDAGQVQIVDRVKDIIVRGGENISSIEVEAAWPPRPG